jgi:hypothetical protein
VNGDKWRQAKHVVVFGHQSFIFTYTHQTCSGTRHTVQWDIPSHSGGRRCPAAFKATSGSQFWQCMGEPVGTVSWVGSTIQVSDFCTIYRYSLSVVVHRLHVFEPTGIGKQCTPFPLCVYSVGLPLFSWCCVGAEFPLLVNIPAALQWDQVAW